MIKTLHNKPVLLKALLVIVFGAFFFVQAQSGFIFCAYDKDFPPVNVKGNVETNKNEHGNKRWVDVYKSQINKHLNLNKRYQPVTPFAVLPAKVAFNKTSATAELKHHLPRVNYNTCFTLSQPHRGPPAA